MNNFAPILIPTLNRFEHFKHCVTSLSECSHANFTDLYIAFDYPLNDNHWNGYREIEKYIGNIQGFKSVNIIRRTQNYGAVKNLFEAIKELFDKYDRIILSEDDNVFSTDFLGFVNTGLEIYNERRDIFSVSGYQYPIHVPSTYNNDIYIWTGFSAWGVGIWKDKWQEIDWNVSTALDISRQFLKDYIQVYKLNKIANNYIPALIHMTKINKLHADVYICMYLYINSMYSIFPIISRVRNMGNDGSGINCRKIEYDIYLNQEIYIDNRTYVLPNDIKQNSELNYVLKNHFKKTYKSQIRTAIRLLQINIRHYIG